MVKEFRLPFSVIIITCIAALFFLPIMPIDETRYVSVAWEMYNRASFIVPTLNGLPYHHKPPLLFWLIDLIWVLFGVNEITPRIIPMAFSLASIVLIKKISEQLWPDNKKSAVYASVLMASTSIWMIWSCLTMFDIMLSFWVLLSIMGILGAIKKSGLKWWFLISLGIAGGILTKGPVIFVHILPPLITAPWWNSHPQFKRSKWYLKCLMFLTIGLSLAALWVIPAAIEGGKLYSQAILFKQTAERISHSFAHQRSVLWYLPALPLLLFPWIFFKLSWAKFFHSIKNDRAYRFCLIWFTSVLILFSLISGKQIHYLIPAIPAIVLLLAHNLAYQDHENTKPIKLIAIGIVCLVFGFITGSLPFIHNLGPDVGKINNVMVIPFVCGFLALGIFFVLFKFRNLDTAIKTVAVCNTIIVISGLFTFHCNFRERYDLKRISTIIKTYMNEDRAIVYIGKYDEQFGFLGRLKKPVDVLSNDKDQMMGYINKNPNCIVIDKIRIKNEKIREIVNDHAVYFQSYTDATLTLWKAEDYLNNYLKRDPAIM